MGFSFCQTKKAVIITVIAGLAVIGLGVGLGVGLAANDDHANPTELPSSSTSLSISLSSTQSSTSSTTSTIREKKSHETQINFGLLRKSGKM